MSSKQSTVDFILEQAAGAGVVTARKMFGEYAIYCGGKLVALVCDDRLFVKPTSEGRAYADPVTEAPPYPGANLTSPSTAIVGMSPIGSRASSGSRPPICRRLRRNVHRAPKSR